MRRSTAQATSASKYLLKYCFCCAMDTATEFAFNDN